MLCRLHFIGAPGAILCAAFVVAAAFAGDAPPAAASSCLAAGDGALQARVRGAIDVDVNWTNAQMSCEGGMRPGGKGVRVTLAGPLPVTAGGNPADGKESRLRFVFGIGFKDRAPGVAQVLPTNLTVIVEGQQQLFATRGDDKCAVEVFEVTPLLAGGAHASNGAHGASRQRIHARGYCTGPASDLQGTRRVLVSTFEFTSQINAGEEP
jgi:hypothetical protein